MTSIGGKDGMGQGQGGREFEQNEPFQRPRLPPLNTMPTLLMYIYLYMGVTYLYCSCGRGGGAVGRAGPGGCDPGRPRSGNSRTAGVEIRTRKGPRGVIRGARGGRGRRRAGLGGG